MKKMRKQTKPVRGSVQRAPSEVKPVDDTTPNGALAR